MAPTTGIATESRSWREPLSGNTTVERPISVSVPSAAAAAESGRPRAIPVAGGSEQLLQLELDQSDLQSAATNAAIQYFDTPNDQWCVRKGWVSTDDNGREYVTVSSAPPVVILQYVHGRFGAFDGWPQQQTRYNR